MLWADNLVARERIYIDLSTSWQFTYMLLYRMPHKKLGKHEENGNSSDSVLKELIFLQDNNNLSKFTEDFI